jgi:hypothetical protein
MNRRAFITLLTGATAARPLPARAQQQKKLIGYLGANTTTAMSRWTAAFVQRLRELGWTEGRNHSQSSIAGRRDASSARRGSLPSSFGLTSTSSSRTRL